MTRFLFWSSLAGIFYAYFGYPILLSLLLAVRRRGKENGEEVEGRGEFTPSLSLLLPAHNEENAIGEKLRNLLSLDYPRDHLEIIVVSDGSTDATDSIVRSYGNEGVTFVALEKRGGKAQALNHGLSKASGEVVVFSDASILLEPTALRNIVRRFREERIGCVSGEDRIRDGGGEGIYGRYEMYLRRQESDLHSIVGASGSFYAQRRRLCIPFREGMAPDFLSVLATVEMGYRAVTEPLAVGYMASTKRAKDEFRRKERTILRGITTLFHKRSLLNPFRYGFFSLSLFSHKVMRWMVPFFLLLLGISNALLLSDRFYQGVFLTQAVFYLLAGISLSRETNARGVLLKVPHYFCISNAAVLTATLKYLKGVRQELWAPTKR
jgi:cellulose synthase/poly-beta-1,6-N-acetylglucosamine synthase-like glycosyltransferase